MQLLAMTGVPLMQLMTGVPLMQLMTGVPLSFIYEDPVDREYRQSQSGSSKVTVKSDCQK